MDVLLIGSTGLVGSNIVRKIPEKHNIVQTSRNPGEEVNYCVQVRNSEQVNEVVEQVSPAYIINTAAYHDVDSCENNRKMAFDVNCRGVRNLASAANKMGSKLITYSSDYVFSGENSSNQYSELDQVHPVNYYGQTKYAGEQAAKIAEEYTVLRPSVIYGLESDNFVTWVLGELEDGNEVSIVDDQISTPTYAPDLAKASIEVAERGLTGVYHAAGPESVSRYEFTMELADVFGFDTDLIEPISTEELGQEAPRPKDGSLDSSKLYEAIDTEFRPLRETFEEMKDRYYD